VITRDEFADPMWRLSNLYHLVDEDGQDFAFRPNEEQLDFTRNIWSRNNILKARQLGFTSLCSLLALDQSMFNNNHTSVQIAHTLDDAGKIFRNKVQYAYEHMPPGLRERVPLRQQAAGKELLFRNGSSVAVTTSARGGTTQFLHVSELGKIARRYPEKAKEILTGSFESVPVTGIIVVESTAEGNAGAYHDLTMQALEASRDKRRLSALDFRLHFYPWYKKAAYRLDPNLVAMTHEDTAYFDRVERVLGVRLDPAQRAWYVIKRRTAGREMLREYPATPEEAFARTLEGSIYADQMTVLRRLDRIGSVPIRDDVPVNTFWDLGSSAGNATAIWLHQRVGAADRFIGYMGDTGKGLRHWWTKLLEFQAQHGFTRWGVHHLPHDGKANLQGAELTNRVEILESLGQETADDRKGFSPGEVVGVKRTSDLTLAIETTQNRMVDVYIDEERCREGVRGLDNYQFEWDEARGQFNRAPLHNWASNPADAFRQWAQGYNPEGPRDVQQRMGHQTRGGGYVRGGY